jgi:hypothetical protein
VEVIKGEEFARRSKNLVIDTNSSWKGVVRSSQRESVSEWVNWSAAGIKSASHSGREDARSPGGNGTSLGQSVIVSCYK